MKLVPVTVRCVVAAAAESRMLYSGGNIDVMVGATADDAADASATVSGGELVTELVAEGWTRSTVTVELLRSHTGSSVAVVVTPGVNPDTSTRKV